HRGEKDASAHLAPVEGSAIDGSKTAHCASGIQAANIIDLAGAVGREIHGVGPAYKRHRTAILRTGFNRFDFAPIFGSAHDPAFRILITGQNPKTVLPAVIDNIMDMPNGALRKSMHYMPTRAAIVRAIDVNFIALAVVEVLAEVDLAIRSSGNIQRASSPGDSMRDLEPLATRFQGHNRAGDNAGNPRGR